MKHVFFLQMPEGGKCAASGTHLVSDARSFNPGGMLMAGIDSHISNQRQKEH